ncbi:hypothetical protein Plhal304r1_c067g0155321 [Plasmopara halstedii]
MSPMTLFYVAHEFNPVHPPLPQLLFSLAKCCPVIHESIAYDALFFVSIALHD